MFSSCFSYLGKACMKSYIEEKHSFSSVWSVTEVLVIRELKLARKFRQQNYYNIANLKVGWESSKVTIHSTIVHPSHDYFNKWNSINNIWGIIQLGASDLFADVLHVNIYFQGWSWNLCHIFSSVFPSPVWNHWVSPFCNLVKLSWGFGGRMSCGSAPRSQGHGGRWASVCNQPHSWSEGVGRMEKRLQCRHGTECIHWLLTASHPPPISPAQGIETVWSFYCTCKSASIISKTMSYNFQERSLAHFSGTAKQV